MIYSGSDEQYDFRDKRTQQVERGEKKVKQLNREVESVN